MKKKLIPVLISALCVFNSGQLMANQETDHTTNDEDGIAVGVGAASGGLIAGPVGFLVGGLIGVLFSRDTVDESSSVAAFDEVDERTTEISHVDTHSDVPITVMVSDTGESKRSDELFVASTGKDAFLIEHEKADEENKLKEIITDSLNIVVHFTPGSVTTESFYEAQFVTVLDLLKEIPEIELNLAGYSDRRGTDTENVQLASQRVELIRDYFVQHGIKDNRIKIHAYGEKNLLSTYGELDSYMFDRRVVISFNVPAEDIQENVAVVEPVTSAELSDTSPF